jgi:hypothetical protein
MRHGRSAAEKLASRISEPGRHRGGSFTNGLHLRWSKLRTVVLRHAQSILGLLQQAIIGIERHMLADASQRISRCSNEILIAHHEDRLRERVVGFDFLGDQPVEVGPLQRPAFGITAGLP